MRLDRHTGRVAEDVVLVAREDIVELEDEDIAERAGDEQVGLDESLGAVEAIGIAIDAAVDRRVVETLVDLFIAGTGAIEDDLGVAAQIGVVLDRVLDAQDRILDRLERLIK